MTDRLGRPETLPPPSGRPVVCAALAAALFGWLTWHVASDGLLVDADEALSRALRRPAPPSAGLVEFAAQVGADLGALHVALPVLAAAMAFAWRRGTPPRVVARHAVVMAAVPLLVVPCKALLDRPGPLGGSGYYPSGHTATALVAFGSAVALLTPLTRSAAARWALRAAAVLAVAACCVGLVVRGYHWPLDVVGSLLLGTALLAAGSALSGHRPRGGPPPRASPVPAPPDR